MLTVRQGPSRPEDETVVQRTAFIGQQIYFMIIERFFENNVARVSTSRKGELLFHVNTNKHRQGFIFDFPNHKTLKSEENKRTLLSLHGCDSSMMIMRDVIIHFLGQSNSQSASGL